MKTFKNLYPKVYSFENLYTAFRQARRGKRRRVEVAAFEFDMERNLLQLQAELREQTYSPGAYTNFYIYEPKRRLVSAAPFRDRVVHHALCQVIEPIWEARFIHTSFACRVGKGTHQALDQCHAWMRQYRYAFHGDIVKYFPSIDHQILRGLLARLSHGLAVGNPRRLEPGVQQHVGLWLYERGLRLWPAELRTRLGADWIYHLHRGDARTGQLQCLD